MLDNTCQPPNALGSKYIDFFLQTWYQQKSPEYNNIVIISENSLNNWAGAPRTILIDITMILGNYNDIKFMNLILNNIAASSFAGRYCL